MKDPEHLLIALDAALREYTPCIGAPASRQMTDPYDEGITAARAGKGRDANPYDVRHNETAHNDWDDGWWTVGVSGVM